MPETSAPFPAVSGSQPDWRAISILLGQALASIVPMASYRAAQLASHGPEASLGENGLGIQQAGLLIRAADEALLVLGRAAALPEEQAAPFVGEEHPRYSQWRDEAAGGNTLLGLADWLQHNPVESEEEVAEPT